MSKLLSGIVKSDKMKDSAVVVVSHMQAHPKYQKKVRVDKSFIVHNTIGAKTGDAVVIAMTKPISRHKHFIITKIKKLEK